MNVARYKLNPPAHAASWRCAIWLCLAMIFAATISAHAAENATDQPPNVASASKPLASVLSVAKWQLVEKTVDSGLAYICSRQTADGSFSTIPSAQPAVTSFCTLALLSRGHQPGTGLNGENMNKAIDYVISCQRPDGLLCSQNPGPVHADKEASHTAVYNHAIAGLMLGEIYGQVSGQRARAVKQAIERALHFTRQLQLRNKTQADRGGWRYLRVKPGQFDSDLSVTAWQLMFMRSARNAEFEVSQSYVDEAVAYVRRCWDEGSGRFLYVANIPGNYGGSRGMVGAGILSLAMAGQHQSPMALAGGDWLVAHPYRSFGEVIGPYDRFFYSMYYCSQAMAQLGGKYWEGFFPSLADILVRSQLPDGSWPPEPGRGDAVFGNAFTTALAVLALTPPYQLLPVYQR